MKTLLHAGAGIFLIFFLVAIIAATLVAEFYYSPQDIIAIQQVIYQSLWLYLLLVIISAAIGLRLSKQRKGRIVEAKKKRMVVIALGSVFLLLPCVYLLAGQQLESERGVFFFVLEALEVLVCIFLIALLCLNARDGARLTANGPTLP